MSHDKNKNDKVIMVETPVGFIKVTEVGASGEFPGVYVEWCPENTPDAYGELLAVVESSTEFGSNTIQVCVYPEQEGAVTPDEPVVYRYPCLHRKHISEETFKNDLKAVLGHSISDDYINRLIDNKEFVDSIREDVEGASAWYEDGCYNEDDIRLAVGRILLEKFGEEV